MSESSSKAFRWVCKEFINSTLLSSTVCLTVIHHLCCCTVPCFLAVIISFPKLLTILLMRKPLQVQTLVLGVPEGANVIMELLSDKSEVVTWVDAAHYILKLDS